MNTFREIIMQKPESVREELYEILRDNLMELDIIPAYELTEDQELILDERIKNIEEGKKS